MLAVRSFRVTGAPDDLISFGSSTAAPPTAGGLASADSSGVASRLSDAGPSAAAAAPTLHVPGEEQLVSEMDQLLLSAQPGSRGTSGAGAVGSSPAPAP